ncbi:hypothetical protein Tcan_12825 [Toxocara canis]|uniref:Uncharacterized protein n=1 Tax=Toxocara canis TaxID=6265 RepID=A0A0B2UN61_TOXCA|nr:hypothetical protein Tcan_12825 [Toxocara canis]
MADTCDEQGRDSDDVEGLVMVARHSSSDTVVDAAGAPCADLIIFEPNDSAKQEQFEGGGLDDNYSTEVKESTKAAATVADATPSQATSSDNVIRTRVIKRLGPEDRIPKKKRHFETASTSLRQGLRCFDDNNKEAKFHHFALVESINKS